MKVTVLTKDELSREEIDSLWAQAVDMDDVDYIICGDVSTLKKIHVTKKDTFIWLERKSEESEYYYEQRNYDLSNILDRLSVCSGSWYIADFRGRRRAIGVAYHS